jgi:hypothetical protein
MEGPRVLVVLIGLMRTFDISWPVLSNELQLDELERAGVGVDVVVVTSLKQRCTKRDKYSGLCTMPLENATDAAFAAEIARVYGRRLKLILDDVPLGASDEQFAFGLPVSMFETRAKRFVEWWIASKPPVAGGSPESGSAFGEYSAVLAIRPDAVLITSTPIGTEHTFRALDLLQLCANAPGLRLVSGSVYRPYAYHNYDTDHGMLICPPATVEDWLLLHAQPVDLCSNFAGCKRKPPRPPPRPQHFTGKWAEEVCHMPARDGPLCDRLLYARNRALPYDALPIDTALVHLVRRAGQPTAPCTLWRQQKIGRLTWHWTDKLMCTPYAMPRVLPSLPRARAEPALTRTADEGGPANPSLGSLPDVISVHASPVPTAEANDARSIAQARSITRRLLMPVHIRAG